MKSEDLMTSLDGAFVPEAIILNRQFLLGFRASRLWNRGSNQGKCFTVVRSKSMQAGESTRSLGGGFRGKARLQLLIESKSQHPFQDDDGGIL